MGVIFGSNLFNLAALIGLGTLVAGQVRLHRIRLALHGGTGLAGLALSGALMLNLLSPVLALIGALLVLAPYVTILALGPRKLFKLPPPVGLELAQSDVEEPNVPKPQEERGQPLSKAWAWFLVPALGLVGIGSVGLVRSTFILAEWVGLDRQYTGIFVLAVLTGLPNLVAAIHFARRHSGSALLSEALNSNTINLIVGAIIPALVVGTGPVSFHMELEFGWLLGMTLLTVMALARGAGLRRVGGVAVMALYVMFVITRIML